MGVSWFSLLAGEIISGQYGIGYFTWDAYSLIEYDNIVVGMLVIGALGTLSTYLVRLITKPFLRWQIMRKVNDRNPKGLSRSTTSANDLVGNADGFVITYYSGLPDDGGPFRKHLQITSPSTIGLETFGRS